MTPKYFDIHTHVNFSVFDADRDEVIKRAQDAGVMMMNVGTQKDTSRKAIELAEQYEGVYACIGLHPIHCDRSHHDEAETGEGGVEFTSRGEVFDYDYYLELARHTKVLAIGETGLDYYHRELLDGSQEAIDENVAKQRESFLAHIRLAQEVGKPLMIHGRPTKGSMDAYNDIIDILESEAKKAPITANFHFFVGDIPTAKRILGNGWTMSFDGPITFAKEYADLVRYLPLSSMMVETDAPYATPVPHRGKRNEPSYVSYIAKHIATIRGEDEEAVREALFANSLRVFRPLS
jgi:TatD DNase family protein